MKFLNEDKDMLNSILSQLKVMGVQVPKMKRTKINFSKQFKGPFRSNNKVFGACLADQEGASGLNPPKFILSCTEYLQKYSKEIGLFRKAGSVSRQKKLRVKIENGGSWDGSEPNDVASLLKQWLRELPEPLIPCYLQDSFIRCHSLNDEYCITAVLLLCLLLPPHHLYTLKHLMDFLSEVATNKDKNQMNAENLALIMAPNIFVFGNNSVDHPYNLNVQQFQSVTKLLIENANKIGEIPTTQSLKLPILEGKCESPPPSSPSDALESSPSLSRKQYLLRSFKKLVKQNTTSVNSPMMGTLDNDSTLFRQTLSVNNIEKVCLKTAAETKGNNLFAPRNSDDVCKRSFRLLRRKDKRGLKPTMECHPFTQSLEIESPLNFQMEIDEIKMSPSIQGPLLVKESDIGNFLAANHFDNKRSGLEDIEMTTFNTRLNEQSNNLVAFPISSSSQNLRSGHFCFELEEYNKTYTRDLQFLELNSANNNGKNSEYTNLPEQVQVVRLAEIPKDPRMSNCRLSINNNDLHKHESSAVENQNNPSNQKVKSFKGLKENIQSGNNSMATNKISKSQIICSTLDKEAPQTSKAGVLNKKCSVDSDAFKLLREATFVIEPSQNAKVINKIKRPYIEEHKCKRIIKNIDNEQESHNNLSQKRQCTALNNKSKTRSKIPPVKRVPKKSVGSGKTSVPKGKSLTTQSTLQNAKSTIYVKGCSDLLNLDKKREDSKIFMDGTISSNPLKRGTDINKTQTTSACLVKDKFSEKAESFPQSSLETNMTLSRKLSFSRYPVTASSYSDSKIPRLRNSHGVSMTNSFSGEATGKVRMVSKSKPNKTSVSVVKPTKTPVESDESRNNLSTLDLSINDSCFLTPQRNAMLSPNSVVWMSGNKYFGSHSPKETAFNKRESIAMILKSNSGHVQAKVHLYDDLIRESIDLTPNVPSHSTPTSKFNRTLSSSQSLKSIPKQKTNSQNNKLVSSKTSLANRSHSLRNEKSLKYHDSPKFVAHTNNLSPIKSHSLKDVTNTSVVFNESKNSHSNFQTKDESLSIVVDGDIHRSIKRRKPKGNSFSGNTNRKFVKKVSRSESSPGCPRPYIRVTCLIQESNYEK